MCKRTVAAPLPHITLFSLASGTKVISTNVMFRLRREEVVLLYKANGIIEFTNDVMIKKYPGISANSALKSAGYTMSRHVMNMVKDSSIT